MLKELRDFVTRGNLVDLAVAFILGVAFAAVVSALSNLVLSFVGAIFGGDVSFDQLTFDLNGTPIPYGEFLTALVDFLIVAVALFFVVKAYARMRGPEVATTAPCPFCKMAIPIGAVRCPECTSEIQGKPA